jgi:hypothetical protein
MPVRCAVPCRIAPPPPCRLGRSRIQPHRPGLVRHPSPVHLLPLDRSQMDRVPWVRRQQDPHLPGSLQPWRLHSPLKSTAHSLRHPHSICHSVPRLGLVPALLHTVLKGHLPTAPSSNPLPIALNSRHHRRITVLTKGPHTALNKQIQSRPPPIILRALPIVRHIPHRLTPNSSSPPIIPLHPIHLNSSPLPTAPSQVHHIVHSTPSDPTVLSPLLIALILKPHPHTSSPHHSVLSPTTAPNPPSTHRNQMKLSQALSSRRISTSKTTSSQKTPQ